MKIYSDIDEINDQIELSIDKFGYTPDHNLEWLIYCSDEGKPCVAMWDDNSMIWFYYNENAKQYVIVSDPIAPQDLHDRMLDEFCDYVIKQNASIYFMDVRENVFDYIRKNYDDKYKSDYELIWPVVSIQLFDPALPGGHFKDLRNALHKFSREHKVDIRLARDISGSNLHGIVDRWHAERAKDNIDVSSGRYHNMIDNDFIGTKIARVLIVDNKPVGFNAGWETPNDSNQWSASIGIHDYSIKDLGIALLHEDLVWIKTAGYATTDLEGSEEKPLKFKTQFFSEKEYTTYKTYSFYINK